MSKRRMVKFKLDEISLVDSPAQKGARVAILKRDDGQPIEKAFGAKLALTTPMDGHGHQIVLVQGNPGGMQELRSGQTSYADGHVHDWAMDDAGNIVLAEMNGHTHGIGFLVTKGGANEGDELFALAPYYDKRQFSADRRDELASSGAALPDGSFPIVNEQDLKNAIRAFGRAKDKAAAAAHIRTRAHALGLSELLPDTGALSKGDPNDHENLPMTPEQLAALQKQAQESHARAERAEAIVKLSQTQRAHFDGLLPTAQDGFLKMSDGERNAAVRTAADADPVVFTDSRGRNYRKSHDPVALQDAKDNDDLRKRVAASEASAKRAEIAKRAAQELSHLKGEDGVKAALLEAIEGIADEPTRKSALEILKSKDAGLALATTRISKGGDGEGGEDPHQVLENMAADFMKADPTLTKERAYDRATRTPKGKEALRASRRQPARS